MKISQFKNEKVAVTGAAGFVGTRFVESCNEVGISVISVDEPSYFSSRYEHVGTSYGKIIDRAQFHDWLEKASADELPAAIVHLGACTDTTQLDKAYLNKMNLDYSQRLWSFASNKRIPFVYASSAATYGDGSLGYDDDEKLIPALKPLNPYGDSKQQFDLWALRQEQEGVSPPSWAGFKFFNVYGAGERHKHKMASVVLHAHDQILKAGKVQLFRSHKVGIADGQQKRDFIFVNDVVDALHFALNKPIKRGIFNLGSSQARSFVGLVTCVFHELSISPQIEFVDTPLEIRDRYQYFTQAKMERLKHEGFSAHFTSLENGVHQYIKTLHSS